MLFRILSSLVNLIFFFLSHTAWSINLLGNLGLRFPSSIVCIQLFTTEEGTVFCSILHSNLDPLKGLCQLLFYSFTALHTLTLSPVVLWLSIDFALFTLEGQQPCFLLLSHRIQPWGWRVAGICHLTNCWLIKWISRGARFSPWNLCLHRQWYCMWNLYSGCLKLCMCQASPTIMYSLN